LPHRALHPSNGVAHHASQAGLRFRSMHKFLDRSVHLAGIEHRRIMTPAAPFRRPCADRVLHVLDALAIPLIVKRREVVYRAEPLVIDILVAALARLRFHEELAGDFLVAVNLGGTGKEVSLWAIALASHAGGRVGWILDHRALLPTGGP